MNFLLIGGQPNTGKTNTISRTFINLIFRGYKYTLLNGLISSTISTRSSTDFSALLTGTDTKGNLVKILIHSATDDTPNITLLNKLINTNNPDIIICSIRDINWERDLVKKIVGSSFSFEIPLARVTRIGKHSISPSNYSRAILWYQNSINNLVNTILSDSNFNLI
jgi:hypothetical protein